MQIFALDAEFYGLRGIDNLFLSMLRATWPGTGHRQGRALVLQIPFADNPSKKESMYISPNPFIIPDDDWVIIKNIPSELKQFV